MGVCVFDVMYEHEWIDAIVPCLANSARHGAPHFRLTRRIVKWTSHPRCVAAGHSLESQTWGTPLPAYQANREMDLTPALRGGRAFPGKMTTPRLLRIGG